jgi:predicted flap endonuclease-1-like 5' DNA nuclease
MAFLIEKFWAPLLIAAVLGVCIGWITCGQKRSAGSAIWLAVAGALFAAGVIAAMQLSLPGRVGLWLETALLTFAAYVVGCCVGCAARALLLGSNAEEASDRVIPASPAKLVMPAASVPHAQSDAPALAVSAAAGLTAAAALSGVSAAKDAKPSAPVVSAVDNSPSAVGVKPQLLSSPRNGRKDDLSLIWGVAEKLEARMNRMGIWHFDQIASWSPDHIKWFEHEVEGFKGRLERDKWVEQCKKLASGWRPEGNIGQRPVG